MRCPWQPTTAIGLKNREVPALRIPVHGHRDLTVRKGLRDPFAVWRSRWDWIQRFYHFCYCQHEPIAGLPVPGPPGSAIIFPVSLKFRQ